jgi:hypothetical protein
MIFLHLSALIGQYNEDWPQGGGDGWEARNSIPENRFPFSVARCKMTDIIMISKVSLSTRSTKQKSPPRVPPFLSPFLLTLHFIKQLSHPRPSSTKTIRNNIKHIIMSFVQELLKPGGGIALIPYIRATIIVLMLMVM